MEANASSSSSDVDYSHTEETRAEVLLHLFQHINHTSRLTLLTVSGYTSKERIQEQTSGKIKDVLLTIFNHVNRIRELQNDRARINVTG